MSVSEPAWLVVRKRYWSMPIRVKRAELNRLALVQQRLLNQRIKPAQSVQAARPADVVRALLAMQAQDLPGAKWSVGLRASKSVLADVDAALAAGEFVRSWPMRGTLHFVAAEDLGWMLALTSARTQRGAAGRWRQLGLDSATFDRARDVVIDSLSGGRARSRTEVLAQLAANGIATDGQRASHLIFQLAQIGLLCLGPPLGAAQAIVLADEWISAPRVLERHEALGEFVLRYFSSHGPATIKDFARWSKLTIDEAKTGIAVVADRLTEFDVDSVSYWVSTETADRMQAVEPHSSQTVHALPGFDEFLLGYQDRSLVLAAGHAPLIVPGANGLFRPTMVAGGRVIGTWRRLPATRGTRDDCSQPLVIEALPFKPLSASTRKGFEAAARRYGRFLDRSVEVLHPAGRISNQSRSSSASP